MVTSLQESKAISFVQNRKALFKSLSAKRKKKLQEIYDECMQYEAKKQADWSSALKVNFANQIESLVTARLTAKNPKFIVSLRQQVDDIAKRYYKLPKEPTEEQQKEYENFREQVRKWADSVQEYLNYAFEEYGFNAQVRRAAKALVRYGNVYGAVGYKYETYRKKRNGKIEEVKAREYPILDIISWSEMHLDPRYLTTQDSAGVIRSHEKVRLSELYEQKEDLMNLDKLRYAKSDDFNPERGEMYQIMITNAYGENEWQTTRTLTVDKFYGYFNFDDNPEEERCYEIWTVNNALLIKVKEIPRIPLQSATCFEDPEQHYGIGYVEPILGLQQEYNFKMNSAIEYINHSLNRSYFWDPNSGIDPKSLRSASAPGAIVPVTQGMQNAIQGIQEIPHKDINPSYFSNQNEIRRDMQALSFTVDTTAPTSQQGFTNTATAVRARFFESNVMYGDTLKHFEEFLVRIAYDMLDSIAENASEDIIISRLGEDKFKWAKPAMFDDAPLRYSIRVEVGSSSFDTAETRREEALALWTIFKEAKQLGLPVNMEQSFEDILGTFEKKNTDRYFKRDLSGILQMMGIVSPTQAGALPVTSEAELNQMNPTTPGLENPAALTQEVVQGNLVA